MERNMIKNLKSKVIVKCYDKDGKLKWKSETTPKKKEKKDVSK
jgi:hypothetical protein